MRGARGQHVDGRDQADSKATGAKPSRRLAEGLAMPTADPERGRGSPETHRRADILGGQSLHGHEGG